MKKISTKKLLSCLLGEFIALISFVFLTRNSSYYWIAVGALAALLIATFYFCISKISEILLNLAKQQDDHESERMLDLKKAQEDQQKEFYEKLTSINESYISSNESIKQNIEAVTELQSGILDSNKNTLEEISGIVKQIEEDNKKVCEDLSEKFIQNNDEMSKKYSDELENIAKELRFGVEILTSKYNQALEEMSKRQLNQIDEWKSGMVEILDASKEEINGLLNTVEQKVLENSDLSRNTIETNISETRDSITEMVNKTRELLGEQYSKLDKVYSEFGKNTEECSKQIMEQMLKATNESASQLKQSCEDTLEKIADRIATENEQIGKDRTEVFKANIQELEATYDKVLGMHIDSLEKQVLNCIEQFIAENKGVLDSNNQLTSDLILSEKSFISEIEKNNGILKDTISNAFEEYSKSVEQNLSNMENMLTTSITTSAQSTNDEIVNISKKNSEVIKELAEKLREYSDSLVEKSAVAIAGVQADNNARLQEVCEQVAKYVSENASFIGYCEELNNSLKDKIAQLVEDRNSFVSDMKSILDKQLIEMNDQMKQRIEDLVEKIQNLNIENAVLYNEAMNDYREKFVEANAKAISEVQVNNVNSITDANEKVSELAENLKKFQGDITATLEILQSIIKDGLKDSQDQSENFKSNITGIVDDKLQQYDQKLKEYNETFNSLGGKITEVINACNSNTANYQQTLSFIVESQKAANSLSSKDIELLKSLMKG